MMIQHSLRPKSEITFPDEIQLPNRITTEPLVLERDLYERIKLIIRNKLCLNHDNMSCLDIFRYPPTWEYPVIGLIEPRVANN